MSDNVHFGSGNIIEFEESSSNGQKSGTEIQYFESKSLKLSFLKPVPGLVHTGIPIGGGVIALIDISTGNVVKSESDASAKVGLFVLKGTFNKDDRDDWSSKEFEESILPGRDEKEPHLGKYSTHIYLKEGLGSLKDIYFSYTNKALRITYVRIGARVVDSSGGIRIREAVSNRFLLKDKRIRNKMDRPISCNDKVWRLVNIGKKGPYHEKLNKENINTVKDFLAMFKEDPGKLRKILGKTWTSGNMKHTINHAKKCEDNSPASEQNNEGFSLEDEVSDFPVAAFENVGEDWGFDGSSSNPNWASDSDGSMILGKIWTTGKMEATINHAKKCEDNSPACEQDTYIVPMNNEEVGLEVEVSDFPVAAFENVDADGVDGSTSNHIWTFDSNGKMLTDCVELGQLYNLLEPEIIMGAFLEEHQYFDPSDLPQSTMFSAPPADVPQGRVLIRWKLLWCMLRWLSIRRKVARGLGLPQGHEGLFF